MPVRSVGVVVPTLGTIDVHVVSKLFDLHRPLDATVRPCWPISMDIPAARSVAVEALRRANCSHVFFVDYDVLIPKEALTVLSAHDRPVACGLYYTKSKPPEPLTLREDGLFTDWEHGELIEVDVTGLGCALIDLSVFDEIEQPWFQSGHMADTGRYTEDAFFYRKLFHATGIRPVVDTGVCCAHKNLETGELFFWDRETGKPTWKDPSGESHVIAPLTKECDKSEETDAGPTDSGPAHTQSG